MTRMSWPMLLLEYVDSTLKQISLLLISTEFRKPIVCSGSKGFDGPQEHSSTVAG